MAYKKQTKVKNTYKISSPEKIVNDFLLQAAYSLVASIFVLFVYNVRMLKHGYTAAVTIPYVIWTLCAVFFILGVVNTVLWIKNKKNSSKILAVYLFVSSFIMFWCIGLEQIFFKILGQNKLDADGLMKSLLYLIVMSIAVEIAVYFIRYIRLKKKS